MRITSSYIGFLSLFFVFIISCNEDRINENDLGSITGKVVVKGSNVPLKNVRISTSPVTSTVFSDSTGSFVIENVPAGEYSVGARLDEYLATFEPATVVFNKPVNVIFEMELSTANNKPPSTPVLISPVENSILSVPKATFVWSSIDPEKDPLTFKLELRNDKNEDVLTFENLRDSIYVYEELMLGTQYFWQVSASDDINPPVLSPVGKFSVIPAPVDNRFLFVRNIKGNNVIYSTDEQGNEFQLTSENTNSYRPRRNVAANKIAYLQTTGAQVDIYTMSRDGTNKVKITSTVRPNGFDLNEINIDWPKNSDRIYFPNLDKLFSIGSNGQGLNLVYQTPDGSLISEIAVSDNSNLIVLKTNDLEGYNTSLIAINLNGVFLETLVTGLQGAISGLDMSIDNRRIIYSYDDSGFHSSDYQRLNSRIKLYDRIDGSITDISRDKPNGTNDLDPTFSPNQAFVIFTNTSNDGISQHDVYKLEIEGVDEDNRTLLYSNAFMPDWK